MMWILWAFIASSDIISHTKKKCHRLLIATFPFFIFWCYVTLQVVGDKEGTIFGGLVEAPLQPSSSKKYQVFASTAQHFDKLFVKKKIVCWIFCKLILQGTNNSFVFTNLHNRPVIYRPTGIFQFYPFLVISVHLI